MSCRPSGAGERVAYKALWQLLSEMFVDAGATLSQSVADCRLVDAKQVASSAIDVRAVIDVRHGSCP